MPSDTIELNIIIKNIDGSDLRFFDNVGDVDSYVTESYTHDKLEQAIK